MPNPQTSAAKPFHLLPTASDGRPRMVLRVGVTGHRDLKDVDVKTLEATISDVFEMIAATARSVQIGSESPAIYSTEPPAMLLISALAVGADTLAAKIALARGWHLAAAMPFFEKDYERDFETGVEEFGSLLGVARLDGAAVELDCEYADDIRVRSQGYLQSGHFMLRHCDLVVGIWNGGPAGGPGGTRDVLDAARERNIPVLKIDLHNPRQVAFLSRTEEITPGELEGISPTIQQLVKNILWPDLPESAVNAAARFFLHEELEETDGGQSHAGRFSRAAPAIGLMRRALLRLGRASRTVPPPEPAHAPQIPVSSNFLYDHFQRADHLATAYSEIHRGNFLVVSALGALAHICGVTALYLGGGGLLKWFIGGELAFLAALTFILWNDRRVQRRERWLDYRLLAEMLREASLLTLVGRGLPFEATFKLEADLNPRSQWVPRAYRAIIRAAGVTGAKYDKKYLESVREYAAAGRLTDHIRYHETNAPKMRSLNQLLRTFSQVLFALSFAIVAVEFGSVFTSDPQLHEVLALIAAPALAAALPAFAYALFAIRSQSEFEILARWSARMVVQLKQHRDKIWALNGDKLTSMNLGRELARAAETMRNEVADWIGIFETKEVEAG